MAASNSTGRNSFVFGSFESRTRPPRPFTYYFYRIFISTWLPSLSLSLPSLPSSTRTSFLRAALRLRDVEEILGWMLVRLFQVFCVKILVIVVDVELEEEGLNEGRSIEWLNQTVAQRKDSFFYSNTSNPFVTSFLSFVVY